MKSLILIGDAPPHEKNENPHKIDWREEAESLKNIQAGIVNSLATDEKFRKSILNNTISQAQIEKEVEAAIAEETQEKEDQY